MVLVVLLGAGGSYPPPGEAGPGVLLDTGGGAWLLDCGEGCVSSLLEAGYGPCSVGGVYVSHVHIDHWAGLPSLAVARVAEGCPRLRVVGHPSVAEPLGGLLGGFMPRRLGLEVAGGERFPLPGGLVLELFPVEHSVPTYGALVRRGGEPLVAYTSDTRLHPGLAGRVRGARLLLAEATLPSGLQDVAWETGHMTVSDFLRLAEQARPGLAVAVHLSPGSLAELRSAARGGYVVGRRLLMLSP